MCLNYICARLFSCRFFRPFAIQMRFCGSFKRLTVRVLFSLTLKRKALLCAPTKIKQMKEKKKNKSKTVDEVLKERQLYLNVRHAPTKRRKSNISHPLWNQQLNWIRIHFRWSMKKESVPTDIDFHIAIKMHLFHSRSNHRFESRSNSFIHFWLLMHRTIFLNIQSIYFMIIWVHLFRHIFTFHLAFLRTTSLRMMHVNVFEALSKNI